MANPPANSIYPTQFRSKFGPKYHYQPTLIGLNAKQLTRIGLKLGGFGGAAVVGVLFYTSGIPRVRSDVLQNIPLVSGLFVKDPIPASDNPF